MNSSISKRLRAFTLIELLVVIAIIAILAAILFPVFARARENARRASCQSNLKQMGIMMMMYTQDFDEYFMPAYWGSASPSANANTRVWPQFIQPYVKDVQVMRCPSEADAPGTAYALRSWRNQLGASAIPVHYGYNFYLGGAPDYGGTGYKVGQEFGFKNVSYVKEPSKVIMMTDAGTQPPWVSSGAGVPTTAPVDQWKKSLSTDDKSMKYTSLLIVHPASSLVNDFGYGSPSARHLTMTNVLWVDGHVKSMRPERIMKLATGSEYITSQNTCFNPSMGCLN